MPRKYSLLLSLLVLLLCTACLSFGPNGSLEKSNADEGYTAEGKEGSSHGDTPNSGNSSFKSLGVSDLKGLHYEDALNYSKGLPQKPEVRPVMKNGKFVTYCARGVRFLVNKLFGRPKDAGYYKSYEKACQLDEAAFNREGLGQSSHKGYKYTLVSPSSIPGKMPEGSIISCSSKSSPSCSSRGSAGHAEMFLGGGFVSGANETPYSLCLRSPRYTNVKVFVLEKI